MLARLVAGLNAMRTHTAYRLKTEKYPCPTCRKKILGKNKHDGLNTQLIEYSKGRYSLDDSHIGTDEKRRRLTHCNRCHSSWMVTFGNLRGANPGCPTCYKIKLDKDWKEKYDGMIQNLKVNIKPNKAQSHWLWQNKRKYKEGKLKPKRLKLLQEMNLI